MELSQILGMSRYEFRMHWRRRSMIVVTLVLAGFHVVVLLVLRDSVNTLLVKMSGASLPTGDELNIVPFIWVSIYIIVVAIFGPIMTDVVPIDRHYGVYELFESLPLSRHIYLLGKLLGMFLAVLSSLIIGFAFIGVAGWLALGAYNMGEYIKMWLVGVIPLALLNPGLSMLLASGQPNRRRAAAIGGVFAVLSFMFFTSSVNVTLYGGASSLLDSLNPSRPAILRYFMPVISGSGTTLALSSSLSSDVVLTIIFGVVELLVVGVLVWYWMRRREQYA